MTPNLKTLRRLALGALVLTAALFVTAAGARSLAAPVSSSAPTIEGKLVAGLTITASNGLWINSPTKFTYQWLRCDKLGAHCNAIAGETSASHTLTSTDLDRTMIVLVTASNSDGSSGPVNSKPSVLVSAATAPKNKVPPSIVGEALTVLWRFARALEEARRGETTDFEARPEYSITIENDRVRIVRRRRGTPIDRIVSELMIQVNSAWGSELAQSGTAAIYRVQDAGKVRMSTVAAGHAGLGVESYAWASSPLRRYVDLVNQRQLLALARGETPPYRANEEALLAAMRDFESAHDAYGEFQRNMERYWCLRWLIQENVATVPATVIRESLARFDELPLVTRVPSLPALDPGTRVELAVSGIDLLDLTLRCEFKRRLDASG